MRIRYTLQKKMDKIILKILQGGVGEKKSLYLKQT